jgi:Sortase and related acyltransferases
VLEYGLTRGHLYTNVERSAVAIWTAPDVELLDARETTVYLQLIQRQIGDRVDEVAAGLSALSTNRPSRPHFTLHNVVVSADARGHGIGAALLEPVLARCDADGLLACLDSSNSLNAPFYERLGFKVTGQSERMHSMVREPR